MKLTHNDKYDAAYAEAVEIIKQEWLASGMTDEEWLSGQELAERINRESGDRRSKDLRTTEKRSGTTEAAGQSVNVKPQIVSAKQSTHARARKPQMDATRE